MKAAAVLAALVVVAAAVQEPGEATGDAPSSSYSSAVVHDESSAAPTTEGEGVLPQDWAYSHVHIQFPSKDSDKPRARGKKPRRRPEQSTARPVPKQPEAAGQSDESSPATSRSRQDVGVSSVNLGYSIGVALTPEDLRVTSSSQTAGAGDQAHPSAHSYSVSNLGLAQRPLGEVITGRPAGTQVQEGSARAAQHQGPTGHPPAQRSAHDQATGQFSLRNTAGRQNSGSSVSSAPFRNDLQDVQLHSQLAQQNQNGNNNALGHGLNGGYNGLFGGGIPAHSGAPQSNVHTANNAPNSGQSTPQAKTNNHLLIHNYKNFQSGVLSRGNQLQNNLAHGKTLSQTYPNNADKIKTNFHGVQQPHNHNNANVHNFSNVYNTLVGNSNHAHSLSPSKTVYPAFVNNVENVQRNGQSAQQVLNNNIQAQSAVNSYRPFDGYSKQVQSQILGNKQLQYNDNGEANNQHSNTLNNFNSNNFHNRNPVSSERYLENERNHANTEHVNNPNSGIFHTTFNIQKSQERNPDISTSSTNEQLAISIQSKPVSFGSMSGDNRNVGNISWRDMDSGMVMNSENTAQRHTPYNGGIMSLSSLASNQAMFYLDNGKQNNNVVHYTTTQNKGFNHENALGNSNIFDHKDAMVSQTQQTNNIQQSTHNQINHNSASSGNGITLHQIPQFSNFDGRFSELTPNLNSDIRPQTNFGSVHTTVPQATNNHNSASSSNKDISVLKATVLGVPGHAVLKQGDVPVFNINGLQPNPIYLNTGLLGYQTSHGGQNSNSPQNNGNFASLPGLIFPFSGTSGLINTNSNNILAASNSQHLASHVVPLSTHGSQSSTSVSHPAGQVALGRHNLPQSYSTGQSSYVSNFPIKLIQVPQFVNSGTPSSPGGNANTANFQFLNYQNLLPGIAQQQHIQLEKGPIQEVPTTNNNQDLNSQVQVNSQSQLPNIQLLFPPPFQQISPANHDTQKNTNGVNIHPNNSQLRLQGVNNLEGQPHIYQGRENIPKDVSSPQHGHFVQTNQHFIHNHQHTADGNKHVHVSTEQSHSNHGQHQPQHSQELTWNDPTHLQTNQPTSQPARHPNHETHNQGQDISGGSHHAFTGFVPGHRNAAVNGNDASRIQTPQIHQTTSPRVLFGGFPSNAGVASSLLSFNRNAGFLRGFNGRSLFSLKPQAKDNASQQKLVHLCGSNQPFQLASSDGLKIESSISHQVPFSNLVYSAGGQPGYNTVSVQSGAQTQQYGPGGSVRLGSGDEWRGAVDTASQEISSSRHVSGDSLQGLGQTPGALRHGSGDSHQGLGELYLGQTPGALRHVSGDSHQGLGALYVMSPPGALRHGRGRGQRKLGSQAVKPVTEPSEEMDGSEVSGR